MKTIIYTTGFLLTLFVTNFILAQQPPNPHVWGNMIVEDHPEKLHQRFDEPNYHPNQSPPQLFNADSPTLNAIIPDFQINENAGPNGAEHGNPSISTDGSGNFIMVWQDRRNGDDDIYAQRFLSDGTAVGENFKVPDDQWRSYQVDPSISMDNIGNFVIAWANRRNEGPDIYAQRNSSDGTASGDNFKVNDDQGIINSSYTYDHPAVTTDDSGNFVITWIDSRNGNEDIYFTQ